MNEGGTAFEKKNFFVPRSRTAAKRVGKRMRWGTRRTWVEMKINSTEAVKPVGIWSGVSPWLESGDATSCKKIHCYFWCQKQVGSSQVLPAWCLPLWMPLRCLEEATVVRQEMQRSCIEYLKLLIEELKKHVSHCWSFSCSLGSVYVFLISYK